MVLFTLKSLVFHKAIFKQETRKLQKIPPNTHEYYIKNIPLREIFWYTPFCCYQTILTTKYVHIWYLSTTLFQGSSAMHLNLVCSVINCEIRHFLDQWWDTFISEALSINGNMYSRLFLSKCSRDERQPSQRRRTNSTPTTKKFGIWKNKQYQGVKEFHMLARTGCYSNLMCIFPYARISDSIRSRTFWPINTYFSFSFTTAILIWYCTILSRNTSFQIIMADSIWNFLLHPPNAVGLCVSYRFPIFLLK